MRDLLSKKLTVEFQSFKPGPDKGIDLRFATSNNKNEIVIQVKHYLQSGITKLKYHLKNHEAPKVASLKPQRYIVCTSLPLSPQDKDDILEIFSPYIQTTADVIGSEDLNKWLEEYPDIQIRHFKLWLSSVEVIKKIMKNAESGRSAFYQKKIENDISLYVPNTTHDQAVEILNSTHFILITGAPGIGKSTLADMLTYQLLAENFQLVCVREIIEAEEAYLPEKNQVFYFDDFLGAITLDLYSSRNADSAIVQFIDRVRSDKSKRLILTCRTTILSQAKSISNKIQNSNIDISNYEVKLENYTDWEKARILYNHISRSDLQQDQKDLFFRDSFYWKVIRHRFYNPRLIQGITSRKITTNREYSHDSILKILNDPKEIWEQPFTVQISQASRLLLVTMYSLGGGYYYITEEKLMQAYGSRLNFEVRNNNYQIIGNEYKNALRELVGSFIIRTVDKNSTHFTFFNPSIEDFIFDLFHDNQRLYFNVLRSAVFFEQFKFRITTVEENNEKRITFVSAELQKELLHVFSDVKETLKSYSQVHKDLYHITITARLFSKVVSENFLEEQIENLQIDLLSWEDRDHLTEILQFIASNNLALSNTTVPYLLKILAQNIPSHHQLETFSILINENDCFSSIIKKAKVDKIDYYNEIQNFIDSCWDIHSNDFISDAYGFDKALELQELEEIIETRKQHAKGINFAIGLDSSPAVMEYQYDTAEQLAANKKTSEKAEVKIEGFQHKTDHEFMAINWLFNSSGIAPIVDEPDDLPF